MVPFGDHDGIPIPPTQAGSPKAPTKWPVGRMMRTRLSAGVERW